MVATGASREATPLSAPPIVPAGSYQVEDVHIGCKLIIKRPDADGHVEDRLAEVLSIRDKPGIDKTNNRSSYAETIELFVHWDSFNKRLDEWVSGDRILLSRDMELPRPKQPPATKKAAHTPLKSQKSTSLLKRATTASGLAVANSKGNTPVASTSQAPSLKRKTPHDEDDVMAIDSPESSHGMDEDEDEDAEGEMDITLELEGQAPRPNSPKPLAAFSKEKEIEKLRTSGSMTQSISEIARVKNLNRIQMGKYEFEAWYFSPYPKEYAHSPVIFICEMCLQHFPQKIMLTRHRLRCTLLHPPGNEIYRHEDISFYEIDGRKQLTWCRNLSLLSKCFLDHKTLYYDVQPFLYYVMAKRDSSGCHIIGYFSKEKESSESYNVACILTLPQHQRYGYGKLLIEFSYELSKIEKKLGSPEKPLSDLGLLGYRAYWAETIISLLVENGFDELSIDEMAHQTSITHTDIMNTCQTLQLFKHYKGSHVICLSDAIMEQYERNKNKRRRHIDPTKLIWQPPVFTRDQLRFGY